MKERTGTVWQTQRDAFVVRFDERGHNALEVLAYEVAREPGRIVEGARIREIAGFRTECGLRRRIHRVEVLR